MVEPTARNMPTETGEQAAPHIPVLIDEVIDCLAPREGETFIDATFGAGGYTRAILEAAPFTRVLAIDRDPTAVARGRALEARYPGRLELRQAAFADLLSWSEDNAAAAAFTRRYDGVVFDLGVSSMQLDQAERGFSFLHDGPLDMRMSAGAGGEPSAADVVNTYGERQIADILFQLGEERRSRQIARAICEARQERPMTRTAELAGLVSKVIGGGRGDGKHPATRTFQALRIYVNDELAQLVRGLSGAERALKPGGRLVVVTFHSLEDRIVKRFLARRCGKSAGPSRHAPGLINGPEPSFRIVNRRPLTSSKGELDANPRARSARLRAAERTDGPAWPFETDDLGLPGIAKA